MMLLVLWENGKSSVKKKRKCEMSNQPPPYISQLQCQPPRLLAENSRKYVFLRRKKKVNFNSFFSVCSSDIRGLGSTKMFQRNASKFAKFYVPSMGKSSNYFCFHLAHLYFSP